MSNNTNPPQPAITPNKLIASPEARAAIYGVFVAVGAVLIVYGLISQEQADVWLQLVERLLIVLGSGLALLNIPRTPKG